MKHKSNFRKIEPGKLSAKPQAVAKNDSIKKDSVLGSFLHSEHVVEVEKMAVGGDGVARIQVGDKSLVVFISKSAPQDKLKIKIVATEKNYLTGTILEVLTPGPSRRLPPCVYALECGGCSWQQISDDEQIVQKENLLKELFSKFLSGVNYQLETTVRSPKLFNYRNRIQLKRLDSRLGYFQDKTHSIVDIEACPIADKRISDEIPRLKESLPPAKELTKYELKINQNEKFEYYKIGDKGEGLSFSQVNTELNELLVSSVTQLVQRLAPASAIELYAGSGNFTFAFAKVLPQLKIEAVELNSQLTTAATKKIQSENLQKRITFFTSDCDSYTQRRSLNSDLIFLDPPRQGCSDVVINKIGHSGAKDIVYVSCHPVSLMRDLQKLNFANQGYRLAHVQIFDMFPQTDHFETLVWLTKNPS